MLSTNAFATDGTGGIFKITYADLNSGIITGLTTDLSDAAVKDIVIPATVTDAANGNAIVKIKTVGQAGGKVFEAYKTKIQSISFAAESNCEEIVANAFEGLSALTTVNFTNATNLTTIGAAAFKGTAITALDLTKTKVAAVTNLMSATTAAKNTSLILVALPETWTSIANSAFEYCSALATFDFGTAKSTFVDGDQTIGNSVFTGTAIESLDFSKTKVTALGTSLFASAANAANSTLTSVTLRNEMTDIKTAFQFCTGIKTITLPTGATSITAIANDAFKGCTGLESIAIPANVKTIGSSAFEGCTSLATVTFAHGSADTFTKINAMAFGKTAIASITIPAVLPVGTADGVASTAFYGCEKLKSFTYNPSGTVTAAVIDDLAFVGCEGVVITTSASYIAKNPTAPTNASYGTSGGDAAAITFTPKQYKSNSSKYYICYKAPKAIKIKKSDAKVYFAYLDEGNGALNLQLYKSKNNYYTIDNGGVVLILTEKSDLAYEDGTAADKGIWGFNEYWKLDDTTPNVDDATDDAAFGAAIATTNALHIVTDQNGTARADLELRAATNGYKLFGWVNSASGTGFQQITSGTTFPLQSMYIFATPTSAAGRLTINWLDEDGNIEEQTTAIQSVKGAKAENGASYNLAGQKVNAAYKGVVIKDGKKYIQK